ncbi:MAG: glutaredoxin domain-containing protein [Promethearchaeota archaeon]
MLIIACISHSLEIIDVSSSTMSLDMIKIPGNIENVEGTNEQNEDIFLFAISTCVWCKKGKRWLKKKGYSYSYFDIDKIPVKEKNQLKKDIENAFGIKPRFPFLIVNKVKFDAGYNPDTWEEMIQ